MLEAGIVPGIDGASSLIESKVSTAQHFDEGSERFPVVDGANANIGFGGEDVVDDAAHEYGFARARLGDQEDERACDEVAIVEVETGEVAGWSGADGVWFRASGPCGFRGGERGERVCSFENLASGLLLIEFTDERAVIDGAQGCGFFAIGFSAWNSANSGNELFAIAVEIAEGGAKGFLVGRGFAVDDGAEAQFHEGFCITGDLLADVGELAHCFASLEAAVAPGPICAAYLADAFIEALPNLVLIEIDVFGNDVMAEVELRVCCEHAHTVRVYAWLRGDKEGYNGRGIFTVHKEVAVACDCFTAQVIAEIAAWKVRKDGGCVCVLAVAEVDGFPKFLPGEGFQMQRALVFNEAKSLVRFLPRLVFVCYRAACDAVVTCTAKCVEECAGESKGAFARIEFTFESGKEGAESFA